MTVELDREKIEANIQVAPSQKQIKAEDIISEPNSDLNLISHLNHHTLFIHKPLSQL